MAWVQMNPSEGYFFFGEMSKAPLPMPDRSSLYAPDFFLEDPKPWFLYEYAEKISLDQLKEFLNLILKENNLQNAPLPFSWVQPSYESFSRDVQIIEESFGENIIQKAVPVVFERGPLRSEPSALRLFCRSLLSALDQSQTRFSYGFYNGSLESFEGMVGLTPEILFRLEGQKLSTMALAGTRHRNEISEKPLLKDKKEVLEHQLVIDRIRKDLEFVGTVNLGKTQVFDAGELFHLYTPLSAKVSMAPQSNKENSQYILTLIQRMHPTPALGVSSDRVDFKFLKRLGANKEPSAFPRARFGAPFGVYHPTNTSLFLVAIRNIQWIRGQCGIGSGCGYVPQSKKGQEWKELFQKRASVKKDLKLYD